MSRYRVLPSTAHNYAASFISVMHMARDDYAMCHLLRAARETGACELRVNLLTGEVTAGQDEAARITESIAGYCRNFGAHVQRSGSALDMVSAAELQVQIAWGRVVGPADAEPLLRARLHAKLVILDDRGKQHVGTASEDWVCHESRRFY
jgi:hypothetical protein